MNARFACTIRTAALCWPFLLVVALLYAQILPCWYAYPDSAVYMELGRNLAAGHGYTYNGEPYFVYPPVFSALLALGIRIFGDSLVMMQGLVVLAAAAFLAVSLLVIRKALGWRWALFLMLLFGLSTQFLIRATYVLSDFPGALAAVLALAAIIRLDCARAERRHLGRWTALAAVLTLLAVATRMANLGLVAGLVVQFFIFRSDRFSRTTLRLALPMIAVPLGGLLLWYLARYTTGTAYERMPIVVLLHDYKDWDSGYLGPLGLAWRVVQSVGIWLDAVGSAVVSMKPTVVTMCLKWAASGLFLLGLCVKIVRRRGPIEAFTLGMLGLLFVTPFTDVQISRYLLPLGPFLLLYVYEGVAWLVDLAQRLHAKTRVALTYGVGALLLVPVALELAGHRALGGPQHPFGSPRILVAAFAVAISMLVGVMRPRLSRPRAFVLPVCAGLLLAFWVHVSTFRSVVWIQRQQDLVRSGEVMMLTDKRIPPVTDELTRHAAPGDVVISSGPALYRGLTGLKATWFPLTRDQDRVLAAFERARWIILDLERREDRTFAQPVIEAHPDLFERVYDSDTLRLYGRTGPNEAGR